MNELSPVLVRQLMRAFGNDFKVDQMSDELRTFVNLVENSYQQAKRERERSKHTLKVVDDEFVSLLDRLQKELEEKESRYAELRALVVKLQPDREDSDISDGNVVEIIQDLVDKRIELQSSLETTLNLIQEQNQQKSDFLSFMSHEIRTPLNIILGISQLLTREKYLPEQTNNLITLESITSRTIDLVTKVIDFEKFGLNTLEHSIDSIDLEKLGQSLKQDFDPLAERLGNEIVFQYHGNENAAYELDEFRLRQICSNLISNALKFTENGKVIIRIEEEEQGDESKVTFRVIDNGRGMTETEVENLFQKFSDSKVSENEEISGSGLGLYFASKLLEAVGSKIEVKSIKDIGSEFYFTMLSKKSRFVEAESKEKKPATAELQGKKILVSDDSVLNQKLVTKILEREGVQCFVASNGFEILDLVAKEDLDLILLDVNMPKMDGIETARRLQGNSEVKIIPLTADTSSDKIQQFADLGINDIIYKPYNIDDFISAISEKLAQ